MLTKEDIEFLKELQNEMKTQDTCGQAAPRFWGIRERVRRFVPEGCGEGVLIVESDGVEYEFDEYVQTLDIIISDGDIDEKTVMKWDEVDKKDMDEVVDFANEYFGRDARIVEYDWVDEISEETGCFLTKRAAELHISQNGYHYTNPVPYAMTAWRNPEFERFLKIFEEMDIDRLKE